MRPCPLNIMKCPDCGLYNPDTLVKCKCGCYFCSGKNTLPLMSWLLPLILWGASMFVPFFVPYGFCVPWGFECGSVRMMGWEYTHFSVSMIWYMPTMEASLAVLGIMPNVFVPLGAMLLLGRRYGLAAVCGGIALLCSVAAGGFLFLEDLTPLGYWVWLASCVALFVPALHQYREADLEKAPRLDRVGDVNHG